jgi:polyisoprenoid-binding protein YceI
MGVVEPGAARGELEVAEGEWCGPARLGELRVGPGNARITFEARMCGVLTVRGRFEEFEARVRYADGEPETSSLSATVRAASIQTGIALRDRHLRGEAYLAADAHPLIVFSSRAFERRPPYLLVCGALELRGVRADAELACVSCQLPAARRTDGGYLLVGEMRIGRSRFGVGRPVRGLGPLDVRPLLIGEEIRVRIEVLLPPP